ncbi:putative RNA-binding protein with PIN domain, partial [Sphingobium scionense]|nr:putative RNA-binding protein with PIN domain [Sphingobium scionense]
LQRIEQTALLEGGTGSAARQKLIEKLIRYGRFFAS